MIDGLLGELKFLKERHRIRTETYSHSTHKYAWLQQRLVKGEKLNSKEATGDSISKLINETHQTNSPYKVTGDKLRKELQEI